MKKKWLKIIVFFVLLFVSCTKEKIITIGFSYPYIEDGWGAVLYEEVVNELNLHFQYNITLLKKDAKKSKEKQLQDIKDLYKSGIDVLLVFPIDSSYLCPAIEKIYDKGVPIIIIDRKINTNKFTTFIGHENVTFGREAAKYALQVLNNKGSILEIKGPEGASTAEERSKGFHEVINKFPEIAVDVKIHGDWLKEPLYHSVDSALRTGYRPDLIYSHNDMMASWAKEVCKKYNVSPFIIGIDGLPGPEGGISLVEQGDIDVTFYNRPGGDVAIKSAFDIIKGKKIPKIQMLGTFPVDKRNVTGIKKGFELRNKQLKDVSLLRKQLNFLDKKIKQQRFIIVISIVSIILVLALFSQTYLFLKRKRQYIKVIENQKIEIAEQIREEKVLSEELVEKNQMLEVYKNELEELVEERTAKLEVALEKAKESDKLKTSFLSNFSHEIRTPLNAIIGFSTLLTQNDITNADKENFSRLLKEGNRQLLKLIDDLVEVSVISTEKLTLNYSEIDLQVYLRKIYNYYLKANTEILEKKTGQVNFKYKAHDNCFIRTDAVRLMQLIGYLIDNAVKFTNNGTIELGYSKNNDTVKIYVKDTGIGIDKKNHKTIFKKFTKLEDNKEVVYRGCGIGLNIAKKIARNLNTKIKVKSKPAEGSVFSVKFPLLKKAIAQKEKNSPQDFKNQKEDITVLIAEDEEMNYTYISSVLNKINIVWAKNGKEAIEIVQTNSINLVLMDIKMPVLDGTEAMLEIRKNKPQLPIIALTAYASKSDEHKFLDSGFNAYFPKPITPDKLKKIRFYVKYSG